MKIKDLFRGDIGRTIETVIHVDHTDEQLVAHEIDEYVITDNIRGNFEDLVDHFGESVLNPSESTNIWVSGFFGSGKSSFAKMFGYALANPLVDGRTASERLLTRTNSTKLEALLTTAHTRAPAISVFLDLSNGRDVLREGESIVLPVYRALLKRLGYSSNELLAELEITLEAEGRLASFESAVFEAVNKSWTQVRDVGLAKSYASRAMHIIDSATFPSADSWARSVSAPNIDHNWVADRAIELLKRRGEGATRIVFVVDEVGQYVARSIQRMFDLQGLAEAFQKKRGPLWLVVTSQERLNDVVDSLESRQVEYARVQDRLPLRVDLLPSDIHEVTSRRVLDKTDEGQKAIRDRLTAHRGQLNTYARLESPTRASDLAEDEFVRLYPFVPYQVQLLIDAVSARRAQGGGSPMLGGANRTIIKLTQQLIIDQFNGLGDEEVGALVTLDRAARLLEESIPPSWRAEIEQVAGKYTPEGTEAQVMQAVALCSDVPALRLTESNLSALLHPAVDSESRHTQIAGSLANLVHDDRLRSGDDGYHIQSPEQKDWEKARRGKEPRPADAIRIRKNMIRQALTGLSITRGRSFKVELWVEGEKMVNGAVALHIEEIDSSARREQLRNASREEAATNRVTWMYELGDDTYGAIEEWYRSDEMLKAKDTPSKTAAEIELLGEERQRRSTFERQLIDRLSRDMAAGQVAFRGNLDEAPAGTMAQAAQKLMTERIAVIYDRMDRFAAQLSARDVMTLLRTEDLGTVAASLTEDGIGLVHLTPQGHQIVTDMGPLNDLLQIVKNEVAYGRSVTGSLLEAKLGEPPRGAAIEVVQVLCAAAIRAGLLEATYQGGKIGTPSDHRLERVLGRLSDFRATSFAPPSEGPGVETRVEVATNLGELTGSRPPYDTVGLAAALREYFMPDKEACATVSAGLRGADLPVPEAVTRLQNVVVPFQLATDADVVASAAATWADLAADHQAVCKMAETLNDDLPLVRQALMEVSSRNDALPDGAIEARDELSDLLAAGDIFTHRGRIRELTDKVGDARRKAVAKATTALAAKTEDIRNALRERFADMEEGKVEEALRPINELVPSDSISGISLSELNNRLEVAETRASYASNVLENLRAAGNLVRVDVSQLAALPITSEEELEIAIEKIRHAALAELAEGKQVRLQ